MNWLNIEAAGKEYTKTDLIAQSKSTSSAKEISSICLQKNTCSIQKKLPHNLFALFMVIKVYCSNKSTYYLFCSIISQTKKEMQLPTELQIKIIQVKDYVARNFSDAELK